MYEVFEHTADVGLRMRADSYEALLADAARGLFSLIVANLNAVRPLQSREIHVAGGDLEYLLFDWLNDLLFIYETDRLIFCEFEVQLSTDGLSGIARGEPVDSAQHELDHEVKAITYHGLKVARTDDGWLAEVIVDI